MHILRQRWSVSTFLRLLLGLAVSIAYFATQVLLARSLYVEALPARTQASQGHSCSSSSKWGRGAQRTTTADAPGGPAAVNASAAAPAQPGPAAGALQPGKL